jgi:hypothetical protein
MLVYLVASNPLINHLPMQKVILRPDPVFMLVSESAAVCGDSLETQNYFAPLVPCFSKLLTCLLASSHALSH